MIFHSVSLYPPNIINFIRCSGPNHCGTHMALSMVWISKLALLHCSLTLYCSYGWMSWRVMVEKRLKESTHTILVKELFRPPVHQTYAHAICSRRRCVCVRACAWICVAACVTVRVKHHLLPIRDALYCPNLSPDYGRGSIKRVEIGQKSSLSP